MRIHCTWTGILTALQSIFAPLLLDCCSSSIFPRSSFFFSLPPHRPHISRWSSLSMHAHTAVFTPVAAHHRAKWLRSSCTVSRPVASFVRNTPIDSNASKQSPLRKPVASANWRSVTSSAAPKSLQRRNASRLAQNRRYVSLPYGRSGNSGPRRAWPGVARANAYRNSTKSDPKWSRWYGGNTHTHARLLSESHALVSLEKKPMGLNVAGNTSPRGGVG